MKMSELHLIWVKPPCQQIKNKTQYNQLCLWFPVREQMAEAVSRLIMIIFIHIGPTFVLISLLLTTFLIFCKFLNISEIHHPENASEYGRPLHHRCHSLPAGRLPLTCQSQVGPCNLLWSTKHEQVRNESFLGRVFQSQEWFTMPCSSTPISRGPQFPGSNA